MNFQSSQILHWSKLGVFFEQNIVQSFLFEYSFFSVFGKFQIPSNLSV